MFKLFKLKKKLIKNKKYKHVFKNPDNDDVLE